MKWLLVLFFVLLIPALLVVRKVDTMDRTMRWQGQVIARQQVVIDSLCTIIYLRGWHNQRRWSMAEANLIVLNGTVSGDAETRARLDSLNIYWEACR